jgi:hypothetical protein
MKNKIAVTLSLLTVTTFLAFSIFRRYQLSLPDPYNNPFTDISTAFMIAFVALWLATLVSISVLRRSVTRRAVMLTWTVVGLGGAYIIVFLIQMFLFLFP